jgi:8-amino-7-oxononanoate synthase
MQVVTDSLFSMDGDLADLRGLAALRRRHGFLLAVDEAHATLVCGPRGGGAAEAAGVGAEVDLHLGTLSKAFGSVGGFLACGAQWKHLFVNRARAQVYSTALPVPAVAAAAAALRAAAEEPWRRERVWALAGELGAALGVPALSPIIPVVVGSEQAAVTAAARLLRRGFHVPAIRPPTVPAGTSRLRVSLSAAHSGEDVRALARAVRECVGVGGGGGGQEAGGGGGGAASRL